jgi:hypothetical protein
MDNWTSIHKELPKEEGKSEFSKLVLVVDSANNHHLLRYDYGYNSWNKIFYAGEHITHWMELTLPTE